MGRALRGAVLWSVLLLAGCGFQLRGSGTALPESLSPIHIGGIDQFAAPELEDRIEASGGKVVPEPAGAKTRISLTVDQFLRRVLAVDRDGNAIDFLLEYRVDFVLLDGQGQPLGPARSIRLERALSNRDDNALGTEVEEELIRREMLRDATAQLVRELGVFADSR